MGFFKEKKVGSLAVMVRFYTLDPLLCVPFFRMVCLYQLLMIIYSLFKEKKSVTWLS